jgi:hypothetical protein
MGGVVFTEEVVDQCIDVFPYQTLRVYLGDSFVDGSVILKNNLEKYRMKVWRIFCELDNDVLGYMRHRFFHFPCDCEVFKKDTEPWSE